jgi:uncharacterized phage protein gp47/JayE
MPFSIPTFAQARDFLINLGQALFPTLNFSSTQSYHGRRASYMAGAETQLHAHVDSAQRDLHPLTAGDGKPINDWGSTIGVQRKGATPARKSAAARVRGAAGKAADAGAQLRHDETGLLFELPNGATIPGTVGVDPDSFVDVDVAAIDTGSQTRLDAGSTLRFLALPDGIESGVILQLDMDEDGFDVEPFGGYRARFLDTFSQTPSGGNQDDFVRWAIESLPSVSSAYAYPNRAGRGSIDVVAFYNGSGTDRSLTSDDRDAVAAYIRTKAPFTISGTGGALRVLATVADPQRVEIVLTPNGIAAFNFNFEDSGGLTVLSWTPSTRELRLTTPLPASLRAGHDLILDGVASAQDGRPFRIQAISGTDKVVLEVAPVNAPAATDKVYSGGPLVTPIRDAIVAHLNGQIVYAGRGQLPLPASSAAPTVPTGQSIIGLDVLANGIGSANPGGKYGPWIGGINLATVSMIAAYKQGVRNALILSPAADYEPLDDPFPSSGQIHYVTPGVVIVRKA